MTKTETRALTAGTRVKIAPAEHWFRCLWFPKCDITGEVEKVNQGGGVHVAVDQLPESGHQHGRRTLLFSPAEVAEVIA